VPIAEKLARFYNLLANMGLVLRDDPAKVIDMAGREWGETVDGLALSIREIRGEHPQQQAVLSVVIKNRSTETRTLSVPGWLFFYEVEAMRSDGAIVPLGAYGRELLKPERKTERIAITLGPGDAKETDLPLGALYDLRARGDYRVQVSCELGDGAVLFSNRILI
jgi:hypothetical protein